jgi:myo-inositol-1(or 4)-monophosphatase
LDAPTLDQIKEWVLQAGVILRLRYGQNHTVEHKGEIDLVTEADRRSEAFLIGHIRDAFAQDTIVAEESGPLNGNGAGRWYLDPLDGTTNFTHGLPIFAISLAYADAQGLRLGVVYDVMHQELFSAERGRGAWLNDAPIHTSASAELVDSLLVTGFPYDLHTSAENNLDNFARFALRAQGVRRLGSAALDLCYVAAGRFDGYWEIKLSPWDYAAGALIAQEAGAQVTDIDGGPNYLVPPCSILVANPTLHAKMLAVLREGQAQKAG